MTIDSVSSHLWCRRRRRHRPPPQIAKGDATEIVYERFVGAGMTSSGIRMTTFSKVRWRPAQADPPHARCAPCSPAATRAIGAKRAPFSCFCGAMAGGEGRAAKEREPCARGCGASAQGNASRALLAGTSGLSKVLETNIEALPYAITVRRTHMSRVRQLGSGAAEVSKRMQNLSHTHTHT